jgi:hypothetical protein
MWSSHREFAGSASLVLIEGADNIARIRQQSYGNLAKLGSPVRLGPDFCIGRIAAGHWRASRQHEGGACEASSGRCPQKHLVHPCFTDAVRVP